MTDSHHQVWSVLFRVFCYSCPSCFNSDSLMFQIVLLHTQCVLTPFKYPACWTCFMMAFCLPWRWCHVRMHEELLFQGFKMQSPPCESRWWYATWHPPPMGPVCISFKPSTKTLQNLTTWILCLCQFVIQISPISGYVDLSWLFVDQTFLLSKVVFFMELAQSLNWSPPSLCQVITITPTWTALYISPLALMSFLIILSLQCFVPLHCTCLSVLVDQTKPDCLCCPGCL